MSSDSENCVREKFLLAYDLIFNKSKKDPPTEPYRSKYEAKALLLELEELISDGLNENTNNTEIEERLAIVYNLLGGISHDVDEPQKGDEYTKKALEIIAFNFVHPNRIICYINSLNVLGYAACKYDRIEESLKHLEAAEYAYNSYINECNETPKGYCLIFGDANSEEESCLEKCHSQTLFYLAQVYSAKGNRHKSARYCHTTLRRQLEIQDFDIIDLALNSATLSQYLIEQNAFTEARNHLAVSQILLDICKEDFEKKSLDNEEREAMNESLMHRRADLFRCWAKYAIYLLNASKERLMTSEGDTVDPIPKVPDELQGLIFSDISSINEGNVQEYEALITSDFILTYDDARPVFVKCQEWLNAAKEYYTLDNHASDHVSIVQDSSQLYQLLAFFQPDEPTQCKLHKRRLDMLDKVANELNPLYYLKVCRELWFELGEISTIMADLKRSMAERDNNEHLFSKAQQIYSQGIKYFEKYLNSFNLQNQNGAIEKYPEGYENNIIVAYMHLGRMYFKLTSQDKTELLKTQRESLRCYKTVLEYCDVYNEVKDLMREELSVCREMAQLIPLKVAKIERYM